MTSINKRRNNIVLATLLTALCVTNTPTFAQSPIWLYPGLPPDTAPVGTYVMWLPGVEGVTDHGGLFMNSKYSTGANLLHNIGVTGQGVTAAVVDEFVDKNAFDVGKVFYPDGYTQPTTNPHGTHVAGIIIGMAPDAHLASFAYTLTDDTSIATLFNSINSHVEKYNIVAVNNSWGIPHPSDGFTGNFNGSNPLTQSAVNSLLAKGVISVAATGNSGVNDKLGFPEGLNNVISVGALNEFGLIDSYSNQHSDVYSNQHRGVLLAPGTDIYSTILDGKYGNETGTSMAAPHVTGAIALLKSGAMNATADEITASLFASADRVNYDGTTTVSIEHTWFNSVGVFDDYVNDLITKIGTLNGTDNVITYTSFLNDIKTKNAAGTVTADDWRKLTRIDEVINRADALYEPTTKLQFLDRIDKLGGLTPTTAIETYGFLRVDRAYKYLTSTRTANFAGELSANGATTAGAMGTAFAGNLQRELSRMGSQIFQRLDALPFEQRNRALRSMSPAFANSAMEYAKFGIVTTNRQVSSHVERERLHDFSNSRYNDDVQCNPCDVACSAPLYCADPKYSKRYRAKMWVEETGGFAERSETLNSSQYSADYSGFIFGYERRHDNGTTGIFGSTFNTMLEGTDGMSDTHNYTLGVYTNWSSRKFFVNGLLAYNASVGDLYRHIAVPGVRVEIPVELGGGHRDDLLRDIRYSNRSTNTTYGFSMQLTSGYELIRRNGWYVGPRFETSVVCQHNIGFDEIGYDSTLLTDAFTNWYYEVGGGVELSKLFASRKLRGNFVATARVMGLYGGSSCDNIKGIFYRTGNPFNVPVEELEQTYVTATINLRWQIDTKMSINVGYNGNYGSKFYQHTGSLGFVWGF
ncbi:MAG: S8 family serine peptidase [Planctomycetaceae bacterium]|jgi:major intracellular serine protease|nr:S8 family serine peptidase [Planctomycetaceae bacterium]